MHLAHTYTVHRSYLFGQWLGVFVFVFVTLTHISCLLLRGCMNYMAQLTRTHLQRCCLPKQEDECITLVSISESVWCCTFRTAAQNSMEVK